MENSKLLLVRLFEQAAGSSVGECLVRCFRKACVNFSRSLVPRKLANGTWPPAAAQIPSCVRAV
jgi:hypothetical protein